MLPVDFLKMGISVFPVRYRDKRPAVRWSQYRDRLPTKQEINHWQTLRINWGVVCGMRGLVILDFDNMNVYDLWMWWALRTSPVAEAAAQYTYKVHTRRGVHVYLFVEDVPRCSHIGLIDIKSLGGYVLIPPSIHPSGTAYRVVDDNAPIMTIESIEQVLPPDTARSKAQKPQPMQPRPGDIWDEVDHPSTNGNGIVDRILDQVRIIDMFPHAEFNNSTRWAHTQCPFHDDKCPSFWIDVEKNKCGCFACLNHPLDAIEFYAKLNNLSNSETITKLRKYV